MWSKSAGAIFLLAMELFQTLPGFAQDDLRRNNDPIIIPEGQTEVKYPRVEEMPRQLQKALYRRCGRDQLDWLKGIPARIIKPKPGGRIVALVPCGRITIGGLAFTFGRWWQPRPISFTVMAYPSGFTTSEHAGFLEWHPDSLVLTATQGNDVIDCRYPNRFRHTYSYVDREESPFVLIKVEAIAESCGGGGTDASVTLWETPVWSEKWTQ